MTERDDNTPGADFLDRVLNTDDGVAGADDTGVPVGEADVDADAARSGADVDVPEGQRDSDGVPVGRDDAEADAARSGADPDEVGSGAP
jgi:hypothetical protein